MVSVEGKQVVLFTGTPGDAQVVVKFEFEIAAKNVGFKDDPL
jgi:hypothetical protein